MMNNLIKINFENNRPTVLGRDLHEALQVETRYNDWFKRMREYGFSEGIDFYSILSKAQNCEKANFSPLPHRLEVSDIFVQQIFAHPGGAQIGPKLDTSPQNWGCLFSGTAQFWTVLFVAEFSALLYLKRFFAKIRKTTGAVKAEFSVLTQDVRSFAHIYPHNLFHNFA